MTAASTASTTAVSDDLPWWLGVVQGIALVILGLLCLSAPGATLVVLVQLAGIYWLVSGVLGLIGLIGDRTAWLWKLFAGVIGILAGIAIVAHPMWSTILVPTTLILVIGIFGMVNGILVLVQSFSVRRWSGVALGLFGAILGLVLVMNPLLGAAALPFVLGGFALVGGIMSIGAAFYERRVEHRAAAAGMPEVTGSAIQPADVPTAAAASEPATPDDTGAPAASA
jgi:uncharacterized membrane protein HdeD (DUF308 family)